MVTSISKYDSLQLVMWRHIGVNSQILGSMYLKVTIIYGDNILRIGGIAHFARIPAYGKGHE